MIRKVGTRWVLYSHKGKPLGHFSSKAQAQKREQQVNYFKSHPHDRMDSRAQVISQLQTRRILGLKHRRSGKLPRQVLPKILQREYARELLYIIAETKKALGPLLNELPSLLRQAAVESGRKDIDETGRVKLLIARAKRQIAEKFPPNQLDGLAAKMAARVSGYNREQLGKQVHAALGMNPLIHDKAAPKIIEAYRKVNVEYMEDLSRKVVHDIETTVMRGIQGGKLWSDIGEDIEDRFRIGEDRAKLIARDQVGKLYGQINAVRQTELGVTKFIWNTVHDDRVREEHAALDGEVFSYDDPPEEGLPGEPINCRCYAEPVFDDIIEEADDT